MRFTDAAKHDRLMYAFCRWRFDENRFSSLKQTNADTFTEERRKTSGSYKATGLTVISNGGKVMTVTIKGTNTEGKPLTQVFILDKQ